MKINISRQFADCKCEQGGCKPRRGGDATTSWGC